jgi:hypothetical protein
MKQILIVKDLTCDLVDGKYIIKGVQGRMTVGFPEEPEKGIIWWDGNGFEYIKTKEDFIKLGYEVFIKSLGRQRGDISPDYTLKPSFPE